MATIQEQWERFYRWGPFALLPLATFLALLIRDMVMSVAEERAAAALLVTALALQILHAGRKIPGPVYFWTRTALAFAMSWLNPFFSVYAVLGYFDSQHYLSGRWALAGSFVTVFTMAGAQAATLCH